MERHPIADAEVLNVLNLFLKRECYPILHEKYRDILGRSSLLRRRLYFIIRQGGDLKLGIGMLKQAWEICGGEWG